MAKKRRKWFRRCLLTLTLFILSLVLLFAANGLWPSWKTPEFMEVGKPALVEPVWRIRMFAFNIAKCQAYRYGGGGFDSVENVTARLDRIAELINAEHPHLVFLSEINYQCSPCPVNQVAYLADKTGMHAAAFGANYSWGLPFYRIRSGNALLSRFPMRAVRVEQMHGGKPFWWPVNNRRILWCEVQINGQWIPVASVRNDSFDLANNLKQMDQVLAGLGGGPVIMGGDFNAEPKDDSIKRLVATGWFSGSVEGPATFPSHAPATLIDYLFAPAEWKLVDHRVISSDVSDHLPVVSVFELPGTEVK